MQKPYFSYYISGVTAIRDGAFSGCQSLTSITIPSGVTSIGSSAFTDCVGITSITIPSGVTTIGEDAFERCYNLTTITLPSGLISIGDEAFFACSSIASIIIPASVTSIGSRAFYKGDYNVYYDNTDIPSTWKNDWKDNFQGKFYIRSETMPISKPNDSNIDGYWHYVNGKPEAFTQ